MPTINQGDQVTLTATVINVYADGAVRIQLQPSLACYDVAAADLTPPALTATTTVVPKVA